MTKLKDKDVGSNSASPAGKTTKTKIAKATKSPAVKRAPNEVERLTAKKPKVETEDSTDDGAKPDSEENTEAVKTEESEQA